MATLNTKIVLRNDTAAAWENVNPKLLAGEIGIEKDTGLMKIGDGEHLWNELEYANECERAAHYDVEATEAQSDDEAIAAKLATLGVAAKLDDIAIVKRVIADDKVQHTAYIYNGTAWAAMDGNYNASNVFLGKEITLSGDYGKDSRNDSITSIGNYRIGDKITAGTSLESVFMNMFSKRIQPSATPTQPAASITLYMDGATKSKTATAVEVGTTVNPYYVASLSKGGYTYGPSETGVAATSYTVTSTGRKTVNGATADTVEDSASTANGSFDSFIVNDDTSYKLSVSIPHNAGVPALDNLGDPANPEVKIAAGTKTKTSGTVSGYRAWFCGYKNGTNALANATAITGEEIRALGNSANGSWLSSMNVAQMKQMFFAAPAGKGYKPVIKDSKTDAPQTVEGPITVAVEGKDGFTAVDYDVWYVANASAASGSATLNITKA